jgi:dUTPase
MLVRNLLYMDSSYILELVVTDAGRQFYPPVGTIERRTDENAGYDLKVVKDVPYSCNAVLAPLGVRARLIKNDKYYNGYMDGVAEFHFTLEPRSSIFKSGFMMANGRGIIDKSYRGELQAPVISVGKSTGPVERSIDAGTRLFQILAPDLGWIREVRYVSSLPETIRGDGGFGSTGSK